MSGHSARVEGAQAMARAGLELPVIQLFGRWGSDAVMGYVRDALLGEEGGKIAQQVAQWHELQQRTVRLPGISGADTKDQAAITELHVEQAAQAMFQKWAEGRCTEGTVELLEKKMVSLRKDVDVLTGVVLPTYVKCSSSNSNRGRVHVTLNDQYARCGWHYAASASCSTRFHAQVIALGERRCEKCFSGMEA